MKNRIGYISKKKEDIESFKQVFPDYMVSFATDVIQFYQNFGHQPHEAVIFYDDGNLAKEFHTYHHFLRSKANTKNLPLLMMSPKDKFVLEQIITDPYSRYFNSKDGDFLSIINFFEAIRDPKALEKSLSLDFIQKEFQDALSSKLGQGTTFQCRMATSDETRSEFFCQMSDEISYHVMWLKLSARILEQGSDGLKSMYKGLEEDQAREMSEKILAMVFEEFRQKLLTTLKDSGAVPLKDSLSITPQERVQLIKNAKNHSLLFHSPVCSITLEVIRYL